ncbi:MAG: hypothetical protein ACRDHE_17685 [Ktedonobacterales bacterium]
MLPIVKWGFVFGVANYLVAGLAIPALSLALFPHADNSNPGLVSFECAGIFLLLFAFSAAGYYTGRDTLNAGMGALAGMLALAVYEALFSLYTPQAGGSTTQTTGTHPSAVIQFTAFLVSTLLEFGLAALMGWLGGRPGATKARRRLAPAAPTAQPTITVATETPARDA